MLVYPAKINGGVCCLDSNIRMKEITVVDDTDPTITKTFQVLSVGTEDVTLSHKGIEVENDVDTVSLGLVEGVTSEEEVLGIRASDNLDLFAGNSKMINLNNDTNVAGDLYAGGVVLPSSTAGSAKKFNITVNDSGVVTAVEVNNG